MRCAPADACRAQRSPARARHAHGYNALTWSVALACVLVAALAMAACSGSGSTGPGGSAKPPSSMSSCPSGPFLTRSPTEIKALSLIVPLGNLNPSGHVFPSDHTYWVMSSAYTGTLPAVVSPGIITIVQVGRQSTQTGSQAATYDYTVKFYACSDVLLYFYHIPALTPELLAQVGSFDKGCNAPYTTGGSNYVQCYVDVQIPLNAGAAIGTFGTGGSSATYDFGAYDSRTPPLAFVNPGRVIGESLKTTCPVDYFVSPVADSLRALLGNWTGARRRVAPLCGTIMQDVVNTAQGRWYSDGTTPEDHHLALVHDNTDPTVGVISMGTSVPSVPVTTYPFVPIATGKVNADFSRVTADGSIYCYQSGSMFWQGAMHVLVQMPTATTLKIVGVPNASCGNDPSAWSMTGAVTFQR